MCKVQIIGYVDELPCLAIFPIFNLSNHSNHVMEPIKQYNFK